MCACPLTVQGRRVFQRELCRLRLKTAQEYVRMIANREGPATVHQGISLRMNAKASAAWLPQANFD